MTHRQARATLHTTNQERSVEAFSDQKMRFDALLAELAQASEDHFGADPDATLWGETTWLQDANEKLQEIADQHFRRGEYARP